MPDDPLLSLETELLDLLLRHERLAAAWPRGRNPIERAKIGRQVEDTGTRIAEVMAEIANTRRPGRRWAWPCSSGACRPRSSTMIASWRRRARRGVL